MDGLQHMRIPAGQRYISPGSAYVEGDASSASYFLAGATITGGKIVVEGCGSESLQGDVRFAEVMGLMGATVEWAPYSITLTGESCTSDSFVQLLRGCRWVPSSCLVVRARLALRPHSTTLGLLCGVPGVGLCLNLLKELQPRGMFAGIFVPPVTMFESIIPAVGGARCCLGHFFLVYALSPHGAYVKWAVWVSVTGPPRGQLKGIDHECNDIPDAAMTLAVAALYAEGPTAIRNVYNWRVKETERMVAIVTELGKLGAQVWLSNHRREGNLQHSCFLEGDQLFLWQMLGGFKALEKGQIRGVILQWYPSVGFPPFRQRCSACWQLCVGRHELCLVWEGLVFVTRRTFQIPWGL